MKILNKIIFVAFLLPNFLFAQSTVMEWPRWFIFPAKYPNILTGFGNSNFSALKDVRELLKMQNKTALKGVLSYYFDYKNEDDGRVSGYSFKYDTSFVIKQNLIPLEVDYLNILTEEYIQAFACDSIKLDTIPKLSVKNLIPPGWTKASFYEDDVYFYGVGVYTSLGRDVDAWRTSEEEAILTIVKARCNNIFQIKSSEGHKGVDLNNEKIVSTKFNCEFSNFLVLERYPDSANKLYYTLIRIPKVDLIIHK